MLEDMGLTIDPYAVFGRVWVVIYRNNKWVHSTPHRFGANRQQEMLDDIQKYLETYIQG